MRSGPMAGHRSSRPTRLILISSGRDGPRTLPARLEREGGHFRTAGLSISGKSPTSAQVGSEDHPRGTAGLLHAFNRLAIPADLNMSSWLC